MQSKNAKRRKIERSTKWISHIFDILSFAPKIQNFNFQKILTIKSNILIVSKNRIYVIEMHTSSTHTKFQSNILVLGCAMAKKQGRVMTSHFEMHFLAFLTVVLKKK